MNGCYAATSMAALQRLDCWAAGGEFPPLRWVRAADRVDPMDAAFRIKSMALYSGLSGEFSSPHKGLP